MNSEEFNVNSAYSYSELRKEVQMLRDQNKKLEENVNLKDTKITKLEEKIETKDVELI